MNKSESFRALKTGKKLVYQAPIDSKRRIEMNKSDINTKTMVKFVDLWQNIVSAKRSHKIGPGSSGSLPQKAVRKGYFTLQR